MSKKRKTYSKLHLLSVTLIGMLLVCLPLMAQNYNYKTQSLFVYKFTRYITWPSNAENETFKIAVYGNSPIYEELKIMANIKTAAKGKKIVVHKINDYSTITDYQIVYLTSSNSRELKGINERIKTSPVLIVGEREGLARKNASINFITMENGVLKFEINMAQLRKRGIKIHPDFLKLGFVVVK